MLIVCDEHIEIEKGWRTYVDESHMVEVVMVGTGPQRSGIFLFNDQGKSYPECASIAWRAILVVDLVDALVERTIVQGLVRKVIGSIFQDKEECDLGGDGLRGSRVKREKRPSVVYSHCSFAVGTFP